MLDWNESSLEKAIVSFAESSGIKLGDVIQPIRVAVVGGLVSRGIWETLSLLGRGRSLLRIRDALKLTSQ